MSSCSAIVTGLPGSSAAERWMHVRPWSGKGPATIEVHVTTNTGAEIRRALATIAGIRVPVTQQARREPA